ncbi:MAG: lysylphosphatidylglycerol synthase transmembrane domain-containing protein [Phocaeicola sp.]|uniref:lysylphosphatidylglycerol synthase transmembrane domain-containing protein n=3 Tax=Bacteroidaceae TaxID=815 RepID=UPI00234ED4E5|nr:lysylphosphatidylglycerol synthase transmembrane domain-containing protein [Phocaeicola oris]MCE2617062.1 flippase-like domain-containing protein [Phocaeicola oris]
MNLASNSLKYGLQILIPLCLGGIILWWMYRDFDFSSAWEVMQSEMTWSWMLLSLIFGIMSHVIRGIRWKLTLAPLQEYPKTGNCIYAIFFSYAANLIIPRVGEVSRCGVLSKYDGTSFSKSLGTVVTERLIDMVCVLVLTGLAILLSAKTFSSFFDKTGTNLSSWEELLTSFNFWIIVLCTIGVCILVYFMLRRLSFFGKLKHAIKNVWEGILSLRRVRHFPLFIVYTIGIWLCYFLQFYVAMFCFPFTENLNVIAALLMFVVGSIAVVVPTPNGAGPWHFAIITMLTLFGVDRADAGIFALITHGIQTFLLILLGIYAMVVLPFSNNNNKTKAL